MPYVFNLECDCVNIMKQNVTICCHTYVNLIVQQLNRNDCLDDGQRKAVEKESTKILWLLFKVTLLNSISLVYKNRHGSRSIKLFFLCKYPYIRKHTHCHVCALMSNCNEYLALVACICQWNGYKKESKQFCKCFVRFIRSYVKS